MRICEVYVELDRDKLLDKVILLTIHAKTMLKNGEKITPLSRLKLAKITVDKLITKLKGEV